MSKVESRPKGHRIFAASYDFLTRGAERRLLGGLRQQVVQTATGRVLEIGAGTGANFPYYQRGQIEEIVAAEPDLFMLQRAIRRAEALKLPVTFSQSPAEALPFPDAAFDTVVATLVLCSVVDLDQALAEVRRVLKPGGTLHFIEHVRAEGTGAARFQDLLTPLWRRVGAGCHLNRPTAAAIRAAGFQIQELREGRLGLPLHAMISGVARRPDGA